MALETIKYKGFTIKIDSDSDGESPRSWDNLGTMVFYPHPQYTLGDKHTDKRTHDVVKFVTSNHPAVALPIWIYEHGNIALRAGKPVYPFNDLFDSGLAGVIFISYEKMFEEYGWKHLTKTRRGKLTEYLTAEVDIYSQYLNGDVYGYTILDSEGEHLDSLWGLYGWDYAIQEAKSQADFYADERDQEQAQIDARIDAVLA